MEGGWGSTSRREGGWIEQRLRNCRIKKGWLGVGGEIHRGEGGEGGLSRGHETVG